MNDMTERLEEAQTKALRMLLMCICVHFTAEQYNSKYYIVCRSFLSLLVRSLSRYPFLSLYVRSACVCVVCVHRLFLSSTSSRAISVFVCILLFVLHWFVCV